MKKLFKSRGLFKSIRRFFKKLISGEAPDVSSRRFTSLSSFTVLVILVFMAVIFGFEVPEAILWVLVTLILTPLGLTTIKPK